MTSVKSHLSPVTLVTSASSGLAHNRVSSPTDLQQAASLEWAVSRMPELHGFNDQAKAVCVHMGQPKAGLKMFSAQAADNDHFHRTNSFTAKSNSCMTTPQECDLLTPLSTIHRNTGASQAALNTMDVRATMAGAVTLSGTMPRSTMWLGSILPLTGQVLSLRAQIILCASAVFAAANAALILNKFWRRRQREVAADAQLLPPILDALVRPALSGQPVGAIRAALCAQSFAAAQGAGADEQVAQGLRSLHSMCGNGYSTTLITADTSRQKTQEILSLRAIKALLSLFSMQPFKLQLAAIEAMHAACDRSAGGYEQLADALRAAVDLSSYQ